jgi:hypothetical protein
MKRYAVLALIGIVILSFNSCILDPEKGKTPPKPSEPYKPLDGERDNVLFNLQKAYNERTSWRYDELLDLDFVFHFSNADIKNGNVSVEQWGRIEEIGATKNLFDPNFSKPGVEPASDIDLSLSYAQGDNSWTQKTPEDQVKYPGETWYEKLVTYELTVKSGEKIYNGVAIEASFVVRWATVGDKHFWRIIAWRDDTGTQ